MVIPTLKTCYFEASEDIITKFKSQALHNIKIKHWKASGNGNPPFFIPALQKIAILCLKTGLWQWYNGISVLPNFIWQRHQKIKMLLQKWFHITLQYCACMKIRGKKQGHLCCLRLTIPTSWCNKPKLIKLDSTAHGRFFGLPMTMALVF